MKTRQFNLRFTKAEYDSLQRKWRSWIKRQPGHLGTLELSMSSYVRDLIKRAKA